MERPHPNPFAKLGITKASNTINSELEFVRVHRAITSGAENRHIDFKQECYQSGKRDDFLNDVCSFANTDGGLLLLGVKENESPPHSVIGMPPQEIAKCIKRLREWTRKYLLPNGSGVHIYEYPHNDSNILVVSVRKSTMGPVYYEKDGGHIFKVREGDGTRDVRFEELKKMINASPSGELKIQVALLADEFRRQAAKYRGVYIEAFGPDCLEFIENKYPDMQIRSEKWDGYKCSGFSFGMITDVEIVDISRMEKSQVPDDVIPMVGESELGSLGRVPAKSIGYCIFEHDEGSGVEDFKELCERSSKILRQSELELLYQAPSLHGITHTTLRNWIHILVYATMQHGSPYRIAPKAMDSYQSIFDEADANPRSAFAHRRIQLPGDARVISSRLLDEIAAFL